MISSQWYVFNFLNVINDKTMFPFQVQNLKPVLTVSFISGDISLMNNYDDLSPNIIHSGLKGKTVLFFQ